MSGGVHSIDYTSVELQCFMTAEAGFPLLINCTMQLWILYMNIYYSNHIARNNGQKNIWRCEANLNFGNCFPVGHNYIHSL